MLAVKNLKKKYDGGPVLKGFSKSFQANSIYLLTGKNGSGKTTLLKIIKGILIPDEGEINFLPENSKYRITYVDANNRSFLHRLSVKENLFYFMSLNKKRRDISKLNYFFSIFEVENLLEKNFSLLSAGQMQLVAIIRGLLEDPEVLLLDEAMSNLDNEVVDRVSWFLESFISRTNKLIIICSHNSALPIKFRKVIRLG